MVTDDEVKELARDILTVAVNDDMEGAGYLFAKACETWSPEQHTLAAMMWCDSLHDHVFDGKPPHAVKIQKMTFVDPNTGGYDSETRPMRWVRRMIQARMELNETAWNRTCMEANSYTNKERVTCALTLVSAIAGTIRYSPRGLAYMGRSE